MLDWFPENIASYGEEMDSLIRFIYYLVGAWFVLVEVLFIYFILASKKKKNQKAAYHRGHTWFQLKWVLIPVMLVFVLDLVIEGKGHHVWHHIKQELPTPGIVVNITAKQFDWDFDLPGVDNKMGTDDDLKEIASVLHVPVNTVVQFNLGAKDVMHSFWVPVLRLKQDAIPGRIIKGWFKATKAGTYPIACAEICGVGHTKMMGVLKVYEKEAYQKWVSEQSTEEEW